MVNPVVQTHGSDEIPVISAGRVLSGFLLSGFLFALLGAILPAWGYYRDPPAFGTVGNYFLSLSGGVIASYPIATTVLARKGGSFLLLFACSLGCASLLYLAVVTPPAAAYWRMAGLFLIGLSIGMLNTALFHAISGSYLRDPAATVNRGGIFFGLGCLLATLLVAGTFYVYTVGSILILMATVPGYFGAMYARQHLPVIPLSAQPDLRQAFRDFRSPGAVMFALLLFFQFGNEWSLAGWLPLFLVRRVALSPETSLKLLALYWFSLLTGRVAAVALLPRVRHGRLLFGSVFAALFGYTILFSTNNAFGAASGILIVGLGYASIYPLVAEKIGRRFRYFHPGLFNGILSFGLMGGLLAPATLGYLAEAIDDVGVVMALPLVGTCMVCALLLLIWLESKVTGR